ncbi:YesL family protein [Alkalihalobacillus pseudalcaliphilus]|uniref:YesL family protein n=1 Tax=Alkalihalobacillus pseudalcaliphilus TaxID=79884 RepID=UPI00064D846A|nr:DUF624 domain-containing protein [Alkalihalobacillus pseudalcaliphilus]KMK75484.1 hypothetical protein AB990_09280 [Alkalihalobacillus pseudalcaliphilus]
MELSGVWGRLFEVSEWVMKIMYINGLWLLFNIPILFLLANILLAPTFESLTGLIISLIVISPLVFFPATTALFYVARKFVMRAEVPIFQSFWKGFRENYRRSLVGGIFFTLLWVLWIYNYYLAQIEWQSPLFYFYMITTIFLISWNAHFFSDTVHFQVTLIASLKKAIFLSIGYLPYTISMVGVAGFTVYMLYTFHPIFAIFLSGGVCAMVAFYAFYLIINRALRQQEKYKKQDEQTAV